MNRDMLRFDTLSQFGVISIYAERIFFQDNQKFRFVIYTLQYITIPMKSPGIVRKENFFLLIKHLSVFIGYA
jgi:hypothetical protein